MNLLVNYPNIYLKKYGINSVNLQKSKNKHTNI